MSRNRAVESRQLSFAFCKSVFAQDYPKTIRLRDRRKRVHLLWLARRVGTFILFGMMFAIANSQTPFTYRDIHDFSGAFQDGEQPTAGVTFDSAGNMYGTAPSGGTNNEGLVWEITAGGTFKDIHNFGGTVTNANGSRGPDGCFPRSEVSFDSRENMYGTTSEGGPYGTGYGDGTVWEITAAGVYMDLHDFGGEVTKSGGSQGLDGMLPISKVSFDTSGDLYGTTAEGGEYDGSRFGYGMVWTIKSHGDYKDLHDFGGTVINADGSSGPDGTSPRGGACPDSNGNLFGMTSSGGPNTADGEGLGMLWELTSGGEYKDLHDFGGTVANADGSSGPDGRSPYGDVVIGSSGNLYGTALGGGPNGFGMVCEITPGGTYMDLHDFGGTISNADGSSSTDGSNPNAGVTFDASGNLYGTTELGGSYNLGMVWEIRSGGTYMDLHDFGGTVANANGISGSDGTRPTAKVCVDSAGSLYGTTSQGGPYAQNIGGYGLVWGLVHDPKISSLTINPSAIGGLGSTTATVTLATQAPVGGTTVSVHAGVSGYLSMPTAVAIPVGASSATFKITGTAQRPSTLEMGIFASNNSTSAEAILTIKGDSLKSLTLGPSQIKWTSGTATATVNIASAAPPGGWAVTLTPGVSGYVNIPATVTIPAGSTSTTFSINGSALHFFTLDLGITASDGGSKVTTTLVIAGDAVKSLSLSPSTIGWGTASTATVNLVVAAPPGGWLVNVNAGAKGYVSMPSTITIPAGATSATFTISAGSRRSSSIALGIYANDGPSNQSATLTIDGDSIQSLTLNPATISALGSSTATVTLASAAPPGGWELSLNPGASGYVSMPTTLSVPAGATTATFTISGIVEHSSTINLGIFASDGNSTKEAILTLT